MKPLIDFTLISQEEQGITLLCNGQHLLHLFVLEEHLMRVWLQPFGQTRLDRSWIISPETAPTNEQGRNRASLEGFTCPNFQLDRQADTIMVSTAALRVSITRPLALIWEVYQDGQWQPLARDRPNQAYMVGHSTPHISHYMQIETGDRYFGLGEKAGTVERYGKRYEMRSLDAMGYNAETTDPLYKHWAFYQTRTAQSLHYGILYDNLATTIFNMGQALDNYHPHYRSYQVEDGDLDYYFFTAPSINAITKQFLALTGKHIFPPKWSLGYSGSTMHYTDAPDAQHQLQQFIALCQQHAIPCDSFQLSSGYTSINGKRYVFHWNNDKIPEPLKLTTAFRDAGIRLAANIKPCLLQDHPRYQEATPLFIKDSETDQPEQSLFWDDYGSHLDFTNPDTIHWWRDNIREQLLERGICATWNDNNEYEIWDNHARCHGFGKPIAIKHIRPLMPLLMMRSSWQAQTAYSNERPYLISRSGCPGMQRYVQTWSGDNRTSWHTLKWNIRMAVGMSLSGMYHIGHDIGGFAGNQPDPELFLRWIQSALLLPRFTIHSWHDDHTVNEPWMYPEITNAVRDAICLRYRLLPYLYTLLWETHAKDEPFVRATFLDHEHDPNTYHDTDTYLIGKSLLVAPITAPNVRERDVYLPNNHDGWYDYHTGDYHSGGQTIHTTAALERLPLYVRAGSIIPESTLMHADSPAKDTVRHLKLYPLKGRGSMSGNIYDDNGTNNNGEHCTLHWQLDSDLNHITLTLKRSGNYAAAWLNHIQIHLPPQEHRPLTIHSDLTITHLPKGASHDLPH